MKTAALSTPFLDSDLCVRSVHFFNGRLLTAEDMKKEQDAEAARLQRLGHVLGEGVAQGLSVAVKPGVRSKTVVVEPGIFDLDRHEIPARGTEPAHYHYDVRFVVRATGSEEFAVSDESHALAWRDIAEVAADTAMDASVRRMARNWLERA